MIHIEKLGLEPSHPQESSPLWRLRSRLWLLTIWSPTKSFLVQIVLFALAGMCCSDRRPDETEQWRPDRFATDAGVGMADVARRQVAKCIGWLCMAVCVALPTLIGLKIARSAVHGEIDGRGDLINAATVAWPFTIAVASLMTVMALWIGSRPDETKSERVANSQLATVARLMIGLVLGAVITSVSIIAWTLASGTTNGELWWGLVAQHSFMSESFFFPVVATLQEWMVVIVCAFMTGRQIWIRMRPAVNNAAVVFGTSSHPTRVSDGDLLTGYRYFAPNGTRARSTWCGWNVGDCRTVFDANRVASKDFAGSNRCGDVRMHRSVIGVSCRRHAVVARHDRHAGRTRDRGAGLGNLGRRAESNRFALDSGAARRRGCGVNCDHGFGRTGHMALDPVRAVGPTRMSLGSAESAACRFGTKFRRGNCVSTGRLVGVRSAEP